MKASFITGIIKALIVNVNLSRAGKRIPKKYVDKFEGTRRNYTYDLARAGAYECSRKCTKTMTPARTRSTPPSIISECTGSHADMSQSVSGIVKVFSFRAAGPAWHGIWNSWSSRIRSSRIRSRSSLSLSLSLPLSTWCSFSDTLPLHSNRIWILREAAGECNRGVRAGRLCNRVAIFLLIDSPRDFGVRGGAKKFMEGSRKIFRRRLSLLKSRRSYWTKVLNNFLTNYYEIVTYHHSFPSYEFQYLEWSNISRSYLSKIIGYDSEKGK